MSEKQRAWAVPVYVSMILVTGFMIWFSYDRIANKLENYKEQVRKAVDIVSILLIIIVCILMFAISLTAGIETIRFRSRLKMTIQTLNKMTSIKDKTNVSSITHSIFDKDLVGKAKETDDGSTGKRLINKGDFDLNNWGYYAHYVIEIIQLIVMGLCTALLFAIFFRHFVKAFSAPKNPEEANESPKEANESPKEAKESPEEAKESPGEAKESPGEAKESPGENSSNKEKVSPPSLVERILHVPLLVAQDLVNLELRYLPILLITLAISRGLYDLVSAHVLDIDIERPGSLGAGPINQLLKDVIADIDPLNDSGGDVQVFEGKKIASIEASRSDRIPSLFHLKVEDLTEGSKYTLIPSEEYELFFSVRENNNAVPRTGDLIRGVYRENILNWRELDQSGEVNLEGQNWIRIDSIPSDGKYKLQVGKGAEKEKISYETVVGKKHNVYVVLRRSRYQTYDELQETARGFVDTSAKVSLTSSIFCVISAGILVYLGAMGMASSENDMLQNALTRSRLLVSGKLLSFGTLGILAFLGMFSIGLFID